MNPMQQAAGFAPTCSVVVCTRNRAEALDRCLRALAHLTYPRVDVLVVDNTPGDHRAEALARTWGARYLVEPIVGLSRARNLGARGCSSDVVAFIDDDAVPEPTWLVKLAAPFADPDVAVVTGRTVPCVAEPGTPVAPEHRTDLGPEPIRLDRRHALWFEMACFGGIGNGNNMAFRRRVFEGPWTGFDERLGRGAPLSSCEEHWAFAQLIDAGHTVVYTPEAVVQHPVPETRAERRAQYLRSRADLAGYAAFLFLTTPYKRKVATYALEAALGRKRAWRFRTGMLPPGVVPRWRVLMTPVTGLWRCFCACVRGTARPRSLPHRGAVPRREGEGDALPGGQPAV